MRELGARHSPTSTERNIYIRRAEVRSTRQLHTLKGSTMTGLPRQSTAAAFEYEIPEKREIDSLPTTVFTVNGERFTLVMPKMSVAASLISLVERREEFNVGDLGLRLTTLLWSFVDYIKTEEPEPDEIEDPTIPPLIPDPEYAGTGKPPMIDNPEYDPDDPPMIANPHAGRLRGRGRIMQRLNDPDDGMDITDLRSVFIDTSTVMFNRPTGARRASSAKPRGAGRASGGATRARRAKTSTR